MIVNVIDLLRPLRTADKRKTEGEISALAARLARGEHIPPQEVAASLDRLNTTPEKLQAEISRQEQIAVFKETIRIGKDARHRLDAINQELEQANKAFADAEQKHDDIFAKHEGEWQAAKRAVTAASDAADALLRPEFLTNEQKEAIAACELTMSDAAASRDEAARAIPLLREAIANAEADYENAPRGQREHTERILDSRRDRLTKAEQTVAQSHQEIEAATKRRDAVYEEIRRAAGA